MLKQQINGFIQGHLWAMPEDRLEVFADLLEFHLETMGPIDLEAKVRKNMTRKSGPVAIIPVNGVLMQKENWISDYMGWSTVQGLRTQLREAVTNAKIGTILFDFDSPGGSVSGIDELAAEIYESRKEKQIVAVSNPLMASAAYYLGANAHKLYVTPTGDVGSIGVYAVHIEYSKAMEDAGIKATLIKAGEFKAEGNPYQPLTEEAQAAMQEDVNEYYDMFIKAVARGRSVSEATVKNNYGKGRTMMAKKAIKVGMVDGVLTFEQVLESLGVSAGSATGIRAEDEPPEIVASGEEISEDKPEESDLLKIQRDLFNFM